MEAALKKVWDEDTAWEREARRAFESGRGGMDDGPDADVAQELRRQVAEEMMAFEEASRRSRVSDDDKLTPEMLAARARHEQECAGPGLRFDGQERPGHEMG